MTSNFTTSQQKLLKFSLVTQCGALPVQKLHGLWCWEKTFRETIMINCCAFTKSQILRPRTLQRLELIMACARIFGNPLEILNLLQKCVLFISLMDMQVCSNPFSDLATPNLNIFSVYIKFSKIKISFLVTNTFVKVRNVVIVLFLTAL